MFSTRCCAVSVSEEVERERGLAFLYDAEDSTVSMAGITAEALSRAS